MIRAFLATYLMVATGAGPLLCCCTTLRLGEEVASESPTEKKAEGATKPAACCCCAQHEDVRAPTDALAGDVPEQPNRPDNVPCPCKGGCAQLVAPESPSETLRRPQVVHEWVDLPAVALPAALLSLPCSAGALGDHPIMPFLSAQDILRAFHVLRC